MDLIGLINAGFAWFVTNWPALEALARNIAADLTALWVLALAFSKVVKPYFPVFGANLERKTLGVFEKK